MFLPERETGTGAWSGISGTCDGTGAGVGAGGGGDGDAREPDILGVLEGMIAVDRYIVTAGTSAAGLLSNAPAGPGLSSDTMPIEGFVPRYDDAISFEEKFDIISIVRSRGGLYNFESS